MFVYQFILIKGEVILGTGSELDQLCYDTMMYNKLNNFASKPTRGRKRDPARKTTRRTKCKTQKCLIME